MLFFFFIVKNTTVEKLLPFRGMMMRAAADAEAEPHGGEEMTRNERTRNIARAGRPPRTVWRRSTRTICPRRRHATPGVNERSGSVPSTVSPLADRPTETRVRLTARAHVNHCTTGARDQKKNRRAVVSRTALDLLIIISTRPAIDGPNTFETRRAPQHRQQVGR